MTALATECRRFPESAGFRDGDGYVYRNIGPPGKRRQVRLHRWVIEQVDGEIPPGMVVMHLCDTPDCFRYDHLRVGTKRDNNYDMRAKGRHYVAHGEGHGQHKLTWELVAEMRQLWATGEYKQVDLVKRFGVDQAEVSRIVRGLRWRVEDVS